jgi:integrase
MIDLKIENIDIEAQTMIGGTKTAAGKNRVVPIHSKILHIVEKHYKISKRGYLFEYNGKQLNKSQYRASWLDLMEKLKMTHTPHECRHTFRSRLDSAGANKVCIDRLMGHKSKGTGERIYTHKNIEELKMNIELITN